MNAARTLARTEPPVLMRLTALSVIVFLDFPALSARPTSTNVLLIPVKMVDLVPKVSIPSSALASLATQAPSAKQTSTNAAPILARMALRVLTG
jgi:hypothetical protein